MKHKPLQLVFIILIAFSLTSSIVLADDDFGEALGSLSYSLIALIYLRTLLRMIVGGGVFGSGIVFFKEKFEGLAKIIQSIVGILNKTHMLIGVLAIAGVFLHCYFTGSFLDNSLLRLVLVLMAWHGLYGLLLKLRFCPRFLRSKYSFYAQFVTGVLIAVVAGLGHLLID